MARKSQTAGHWCVPVSFCIMAAVLMGCSIERVDKGGSSATTDGGQADESGAAATGAGSRPNDEEKPVVAFVTNGVASFWTVAEAGCRAAERDFNCEVLVRMPDGAADQKRMLEELISLQVDGAAVSPIDPENQADILNAVGQAANFITQDSDAPNTQRIAYVGMDNYKAGRTCGKLVKEAMPEGGEVMIFVGRLGQLNADLRRQGLIDELLDRDDDSSRRDPPSAKLTNGKYTILDTRTDNFDFGAAKAQVEDTIVKHPSVGCMVGLFAYNPPAILEAVQGADKLGQIKIVAFDEDEGTLQGITDGHCFGTVVQDPYQYGYESVRILAQLARGDRSVLPENKFKEFPARVIRQDNVAEFWEDLKQKMELGRSKADSPQTSTRVRLAFVTNNASDFWKIAEAGVRKAEQEFDVECEMQIPPNGTADDQQRIVEALIAKGITGMAISPNDAQNQIDLIDQAAEVMNVICHDSDAPDSKRLAYVGTQNYKAGRQAGKQIKQILPEGGKIMLFVGKARRAKRPRT